MFYEESLAITQLRYFPYVQLVIIGLFPDCELLPVQRVPPGRTGPGLGGYGQETAHQLGTPLSSLMAWVDLLRSRGTGSEPLNEMRKDLDRLDVITQRFSKIGSEPDLQPEKLYHMLRATVLYLRPRLPSRRRSRSWCRPTRTGSALNRALFSWWWRT